ncbi:hypothetical protein ZWY2020_023288 [Hordeum vulgare]|nr:hypothetical protein ZWY2020_023288 [Hordeum vulgare]
MNRVPVLFQPSSLPASPPGSHLPSSSPDAFLRQASGGQPPLPRAPAPHSVLDPAAARLKGRPAWRIGAGARSPRLQVVYAENYVHLDYPNSIPVASMTLEDVDSNGLMTVKPRLISLEEVKSIKLRLYLDSFERPYNIGPLHEISSRRS